MKNLLLIVGGLVLLSGLGNARAGDCPLTVEANDQMQFNQRQMMIATDCTTVTMTLKHAGMQPMKTMGHDWVLAKSSDVNALVIAGMNAGLANNFQPANDQRIIASTHVVGGGESTTIHFATDKMQPGGDYTFFCTYPGHYVLMKGAFVFGDRAGARVAANVKAGGHVQ